MKKIITLVIIMASTVMSVAACGNDGSDEPIVNESAASDSDESNQQNAYTMNITVNGKTLSATMVANSSTAALKELLEAGDLTYTAHDYGNFEKVGDIGHTLPQNDEEITTEPGDIILYQGNNICLYYDTNQWNFTRLGKINNVTQSELKSFLNAGGGNITVTLSLDATTGLNRVVDNSSIDDEKSAYTIDGRRLSPDSARKGIVIVNGRKILY